jgi:hypothetical protein
MMDEVQKPRNLESYYFGLGLKVMGSIPDDVIGFFN